MNIEKRLNFISYFSFNLIHKLTVNSRQILTLTSTYVRYEKIFNCLFFSFQRCTCLSSFPLFFDVAITFVLARINVMLQRWTLFIKEFGQLISVQFRLLEFSIRHNYDARGRFCPALLLALTKSFASLVTNNGKGVKRVRNTINLYIIAISQGNKIDCFMV